MKYSLRYRAFQTAYHSRFVALEDDLGHRLTDDEVRDEAAYLLECLPYSNTYDASAQQSFKMIT